MYYKEIYLLLFDATAKAIDLLVEAQQQAEKLYIEHEKAPVIFIDPKEPPASRADQ